MAFPDRRTMNVLLTALSQLANSQAPKTAAAWYLPRIKLARPVQQYWRGFRVS